MISIGEVDAALRLVMAAHGRSNLPKGMSELWYKEFENLDDRAFQSAIEQLKFADDFPNLATVRSAANAARFALRSTATVGKKGCEYCKGGYVHYHKAGYEYAGACIHCKTAPKGLTWIDPRKVDLLFKHGDNDPYKLSMSEQKEMLRAIADMCDAIAKKNKTERPNESLRARRLWRDQARDYEPTNDDRRV